MSGFRLPTRQSLRGDPSSAPAPQTAGGGLVATSFNLPPVPQDAMSMPPPPPPVDLPPQANANAPASWTRLTDGLPKRGLGPITLMAIGMVITLVCFTLISWLLKK
jgi:hypothetical protein